MNKIPEILNKIYYNLELRNTCIPLFVGNPGLGKTKLIEKFAKEKGVNIVEVIASQLMPHEISGIAIPDQSTKLMSYFDFDRFINLKEGDILFFDELLNANPIVLNACLTLLENRKMISGKPLKDIMILAAGNNQGSSILTPQIKERFIWYDVKFDPISWSKYMYKKYNITDDCLIDLISLIKNETFSNSNKNYHTPRSIDKAINMLINDVPSPYNSVKVAISKLITNNTNDDIIINDKFTFIKNEKISWLELQKIIYKKDD